MPRAAAKTGPSSPTLRQVAARAQVSLQTVSNVLNHPELVAVETAARVRRAIEATGYRSNYAARALRSGSSRTLACVVTDAAERDWLLKPYFARLFQGVALAAERRGFLVLFHSEREPGATRLRKLFEERRVDGAIVAGATTPIATLKAIGRFSHPIVFVDRAVPGSPSFVAQYQQPVAELVRYLASGGRRRFAFLGGGLASKESGSTGRERLAGFELGLKQAGLSCPSSRIVDVGWSPEAAGAAAGHLLESGTKVDAIVAASDALAAGAMKALLAKGVSIPADVAVTGFDDDPISRLLTPALTTVHLDIERMADLATSRLIDWLDAPDQVKREVVERVDTPLVFRASA